jgi:hypothetical protein
MFPVNVVPKTARDNVSFNVLYLRQREMFPVKCCT